MTAMTWVLAVGLLLGAMNLCVLYAIVRDVRHRVERLEWRRTGDVGPCGHRAPTVDHVPPIACELNAGHTGGHQAATPGFPGTPAQWWEDHGRAQPS